MFSFITFALRISVDFGLMCVGVTLQCGYGGVVSVCRLKPAYGCIRLKNELFLIVGYLSD